MTACDWLLQWQGTSCRCPACQLIGHLITGMQCDWPDEGHRGRGTDLFVRVEAGGALATERDDSPGFDHLLLELQMNT